MPEEMYGKTFDKLFKFLLDKGLVSLGLYRLVGAQDNFTHPYVFTNPGAKTLCTAKDRVFVLGKEIPKDFIINFSKKGGVQEAMKKNANNGIQEIQTSSKSKLKEENNVGINMKTRKDFYGLKSQSKKAYNMNEDNLSIEI